MIDISRKLVLTYTVFAVGCAIAFTTDTTLGEYTAFAAIILAAYGAANVTDKWVGGPNGR